MFAPTPVWARPPKNRRGERRAAAAAPASTDPALDAGEAGSGAGVMGATTAAEPADSAYETQPATRTMRRGVSPVAIGVGVAAVIVLGAAGWYAARPHEQSGVPELTPGAPASGPAPRPAPGQTALNTSAPNVPAPPPAGRLTLTPASDPAPASQPPSTTATTTRKPPAATDENTAGARRTPRTPQHVRPMSDYSAMDTGVDASATAPMVQPPAPPGSAAKGAATTPGTGPAPGTGMAAPGTAVNPTPSPDATMATPPARPSGLSPAQPGSPAAATTPAPTTTPMP